MLLPLTVAAVVMPHTVASQLHVSAWRMEVDAAVGMPGGRHGGMVAWWVVLGTGERKRSHG